MHKIDCRIDIVRLPKWDGKSEQLLSGLSACADFSVGANGVVMASNDVLHQKNCIHTSVDETPLAHDHSGHADHAEASNDAAPEHDHNTCMMHACSAVVCEAHGAFAAPIFLSAVLTVTEQPLTPLGLAESFLRPPNT